MKASSYEEKIIDILLKSKCRFEREKRFSDLKHGKLRFDFYVEIAIGQNFLIEVQGEGHYYPIKKFHKTRKDFKSAQERDRRKISYCLAHNIPLYCIPYWEIDNIHSINDILQPKYRAKDRWKNDKDWQIYQATKNLTH